MRLHFVWGYSLIAFFVLIMAGCASFEDQSKSAAERTDAALTKWASTDDQVSAATVAKETEAQKLGTYAQVALAEDKTPSTLETLAVAKLLLQKRLLPKLKAKDLALIQADVDKAAKDVKAKDVQLQEDNVVINGLLKQVAEKDAQLKAVQVAAVTQHNQEASINRNQAKKLDKLSTWKGLIDAIFSKAFWTVVVPLLVILVIGLGLAFYPPSSPVGHLILAVLAAPFIWFYNFVKWIFPEVITLAEESFAHFFPTAPAASPPVSPTPVTTTTSVTK